MKKLMQMTMVLVVMAGSAMATTTSWTFDTGNQGWKADNGNSAGWNSSKQALQNQFSNTTGTLYMDGLNINVGSAADYIQLDSTIETVASWCQWASWNLIVTTANGNHYGQIGPDGQGNDIWETGKKFLLVGDLGLSVGDTITKITVSSYSAGQQSMYVDNVVVNTVPEPATIGLLMLGGIFGLKKRS